MNKEKLRTARKSWEASYDAYEANELHSIAGDDDCVSLIEYCYPTDRSNYRVYRYFEVAGEILCSVDIDTKEERDAWIKMIDMTTANTP